MRAGRNMDRCTMMYMHRMLFSQADHMAGCLTHLSCTYIQ